MMIGHIAPWLYVGTPSWDVPDDSIVGQAASVADQVLVGTADGVNQIQVRFRARARRRRQSRDQMVAVRAHVAPALVKV